MLFNSLVFLVFLGLFLAGWSWARERRQRRWAYLTLLSLVFYGWWDWRFLFLIIFSGLVDYWAAARMVASPGHRRTYLVLSLIANLGSLAVFKYSGFLAQALEDLLALQGMDVDLLGRLPAFSLVLPVGISFYTFQSMSYTIDVYRGKLTPTPHILHFFAYLVMFPQLVAGPIVRAWDMLDQLARDRVVTGSSLWVGVKLFLYGMFQKVVLADNVARLVDSVFGGVVVAQGALVWWVATVAFAIQIYCDFSGYSLMARGIARMLGYRFKMNFDHPYRSVSFREFWTRWHISLSTWFRDYVYIPLGGARRGFWRGILNMAITMVVSGLWHGANWTFIVWGGLHAVYLTAERLLGRMLRGLARPPAWTGYPFVVLGVLIGWVFFRAKDVHTAFGIVRELFGRGWSPTLLDGFSDELFFLALALLMELGLFLAARHGGVERWLMRRPALDGALMAMVAICCIFLRGPEAAFIYFQF